MARRNRDPKAERMLARSQAILARAEARFGKDRLAAAVSAMKRRRIAADRSKNARAIHQLTADGLSADAIAERLGLSIHYVRQVRSRTGILSQRRQEKANRTRELIAQLSSQGVPVAEIARRLKLSRPYVSQVRMELGLAPARKRKP